MDKILMLCPSEHRCQIKNKWNAAPPNSSCRWKLLCQYFASLSKTRQSSKWTKNNLCLVPTEIMFQFCYPRLDAHVSKSINHLLKAPFCVHPKTGKLSVPIEDINRFSLEDVPTIVELIQDLGSANMTYPSKLKLKTTKEYKRTKLRPYVEYFESFVRKNIADSRGEKQMLKDIQQVVNCDI
ncbi:hypothetical protein GJ496_011601 [Pomphorhynchus laevis]|nr:hypothetical protein GJ496_011601 [Pomphorhynchus laevis]